MSPLVEGATPALAVAALAGLLLLLGEKGGRSVLDGGAPPHEGPNQKDHQKEDSGGGQGERQPFHVREQLRSEGPQELREPPPQGFDERLRIGRQSRCGHSLVHGALLENAPHELGIGGGVPHSGGAPSAGPARSSIAASRSCPSLRPRRSK